MPDQCRRTVPHSAPPTPRAGRATKAGCAASNRDLPPSVMVWPRRLEEERPTCVGIRSSGGEDQVPTAPDCRTDHGGRRGRRALMASDQQTGFMALLASGHRSIALEPNDRRSRCPPPAALVLVVAPVSGGGEPPPADWHGTLFRLGRGTVFHSFSLPNFGAGFFSEWGVTRHPTPASMLGAAFDSSTD